MKPSPLHEQHTKLGASFTEITGWTMPAQYGHVAAEYTAVRRTVGITDLSHRGRLRVTGDDRTKWLQSIISNDILPLATGRGLYSSLLTHKGKMLTYFRIYALPDALLVEDAGDIGDTTMQTLRKFLLYGTKAKMESLRDSWCLLLVSGPRSVDLIRAALGVEAGALAPLSCLSHTVEGTSVMLLRTQETGETDFEVLVPTEHVGAIWDRLWQAGQPLGLRAFGTDAHEALRIEAGLPQAGADLTEEIVPPEANLEGKAFSLSKGCYPGQEVVARMDTYGNVRRHLVGLRVESDALPVKGAKLFSGDREVGWVSSAVRSPSVNNPIALGFPLRDFSSPGTALTIEVEGTKVPATVTALPFSSTKT
ncbi:MAG: aminomethyl transferase family protein [Nitrospirae bacterium]|nr:aminomethyl transferase family protein [Nitrospirota bacterium]